MSGQEMQKVNVAECGGKQGAKPVRVRISSGDSEAGVVWDWTSVP